MKILLFSIFLNSFAYGISPNEKAPALKLLGNDSKIHSLEKFKGKPVVLEWLNHGCPFVKKHYDSGNMQETQKRAKKRGFTWISIISSAEGKQGHVNSAQAAKDMRSKKSQADFVLLDPTGKVGRLYKAKTTPYMVILNKNHIVKYTGAIDSIASADPADIPNSENYVDSMTKEIMADLNFKGHKTQSYGCSVKY